MEGTFNKDNHYVFTRGGNVTPGKEIGNHLKSMQRIFGVRMID